MSLKKPKSILGSNKIVFTYTLKEWKVLMHIHFVMPFKILKSLVAKIESIYCIVK